MEPRKVFPHRISLEKNNVKCDICWKTSNINCINLNRYVGFCYCSDTCKKTIEYYMKQTTKTIDELEARYGNNFKVLRGSPINDLEGGWSIDGMAFKEKESGPFWVQVSNGNSKLKHVRLDDLDIWNEIST